jgi:hypothetical protein
MKYRRLHTSVCVRVCVNLKVQETEKVIWAGCSFKYCFMTGIKIFDWQEEHSLYFREVPVRISNFVICVQSANSIATYFTN